MTDALLFACFMHVIKLLPVISVDASIVPMVRSRDVQSDRDSTIRFHVRMRFGPESMRTYNTKSMTLHFNAVSVINRRRADHFD